MSRTAIARLALMVLAISVGGVARPARAGSAYILKDLGTLPGDSASVGYAVNASGQVAGESRTASGALHAFLSGPGGGPLKDLGTLGGGGGEGHGVNASGQVTGWSQAAGFDQYHAFLSGPNGGPLKDLGTLGGETDRYSASFGLAVNDSGQVAGVSLTAGGAFHAFLSGPGGGPLKDLGTLPGDNFSQGYGVNAFGQVAGSSGIETSDQTLVRSSVFLSGPNGGPLKFLGGFLGMAVNASGQVTGSSGRHAFLSGPDGGGPLKDLGTLPGTDFSLGTAVNASGQVVGYTDTHAFLYSGGQMLDLNDLIAPGSGFTLVRAFGINDNGYITGDGTGPGGQHAFLLIPTAIPEPSGLVLLGIGAVGLLACAARRRARTRAGRRG
jgi:probable HAF family extracellular repeat protein